MAVYVKVCYLSVILLMSLEWTSAQAPGDESANCLDPNSEDYVAPLDTERFLMQSRYYNTLLGSSGVWTALDDDGDRRTWGIGFGGRCQRTVRTCNWQFPGQENWLLTQHISKDISQQSDTYGITVFVDIKWRFETCTDDSCSRNLQVHRFISNTQQLPDVSQRIATFLGAITGNSGSSGSRTLSFTLGTSQDGFYIGIRSTGSCITIDQLTVRRQRCPPQQVGLVLYPDTHAPEIGQVQVDATCVDGASADSSLRVVCESSGAWMGSPTCTCDCGYVESSSSPRMCTACSGGSYRSNTDSTCQTCPDNTIDAGEGACECPCASGFYRTATEGVGTACTSPPSPLNCGFLRVSEAETTSTSITVQWQSPTTTGRDDYFYTIKHTNPNDPAGNLLVYQQRYKPTAITLTGLRPDTGYRIEVSVHNGVSDQDPDGDPQRTCEVSETTTEGRPGEPSGIRSLCTAVVWGPPAQPNGVIVGYDIQFRRIGTSQAISTPKGANELFHVVEGSSIPPGQGDLEFSVRARNSQQGMDSSWTQLGSGCPTDSTSCPTNPPTTPTPPTRPGKIIVTNSFNCETIVWEPPANTGGEITGYTVRVYYKVNGRNFTTNHPVSDPDRHWLSPSSLPPQRPLYYQVQVRNSVGVSQQWSDERVLTDSANCPTPPITRPGKITVTNSFNCETIVWEPPANTGGEITGYIVRVYYKVNELRTDGSTTTHPVSDADRHWLSPSSLPEQRPLYYQVLAKNSAGLSQEWSDERLFTDTTDCVTPPTPQISLPDSSDCPLAECPTIPPSPMPITRPGRIHLLQVVNGMAMWSPPESTGGEISLYVVRVYYRSAHFQFKINVHYYTTEREWIDLQDTPPERTFFMQVRAQNSAGAGLWSREVQLP